MATIQIADNDARKQYSGNTIVADTTTLAIDFPFFTENDINVIVTNSAGVDTILSRGTGTGTFTVAGTAVDDGFSGGNITLGDAYTTTDTITIFRDIPIERTTDFPTSGPFSITSLNTDLDKIFAIAQQNETAAGRAVSLKNSDTTTSLELPISTVRANNVLAFDSNGNIDVSISGSQVSALASASSQAQSDAADALQHKIDAEAAKLAAETARNQAQASQAALNIPAPASVNVGNFIKVNAGATGFEFAPPATDTAVFYGLRIDASSNLILDYSVAGGSSTFNIADYDNYMIGSSGMVFSINTSGELVVSLP